MAAMALEVCRVKSAAEMDIVKRINRSTLPVRYSDKFYKQLLADASNSILRIAKWKGVSVGAICCRLDPVPAKLAGARNASKKRKRTQEELGLHVLTLGTLPVYRSKGIASSLFSDCIKQLKSQRVGLSFLHVHVGNKKKRTKLFKQNF